MKDSTTQDMPDDVAAVFKGYAAPTRSVLLKARSLILLTASETDGVGPITETLKWGQPAYLTQSTGSGTTIRLGHPKNAPVLPMMFFNCRTSLVEEFRQAFSDTLEFEGNRALKLVAYDKITDRVRFCIQAALTYHLRKKV